MFIILSYGRGMLKMNEYIKVSWEHDIEDEPTLIFYEVCIDNERLAKRSIIVVFGVRNYTLL